MGRGEGTQPAKGVGGYRPTTNWREITVKRRSVAARQVLACIIVSGVVIMCAGVLLTVLGFLVIASQCPFMWRQGAGSCYYLAPHNASWEEGRSYCTSQSADLLHLSSNAEADFITGVMAGRSWLGARRKRGRDSPWVAVQTGTPLNFTRWSGGGGEPASLQEDLCAAIEPDGGWVAEACSGAETAYVICDYVPGYNPFMLVGPVVAACGVVVLVLSVEVCVRRREFIHKNPEAITDDQDDDRQVDSGIINYGYGHFGAEEGEEGGGGGEESTQDPRQPRPALSVFKATQREPSPQPNTHSAPSIQRVVVSPQSERNEEEEKVQEKEKEIEVVKEVKDKEVVVEGGVGPKVEIVPASPSSLSPPSMGENSPSQEKLELLLSPKTLE